MLKTCLGLALLLFFSTNSLASPDDRYFDSRKIITQKVVKQQPPWHHARHKQVRQHVARRYFHYRHVTWTRARHDLSAVSRAGVVLGGRPEGCPPRYCGCGASLYLFGKIIPKLNLAANWLRVFPRAAPAPGMAAARPGHVWVLVRHVHGDVWIGHDSNSRGHKTLLHARSINGYVVVNPRG